MSGILKAMTTRWVLFGVFLGIGLILGAAGGFTVWKARQNLPTEESDDDSSSELLKDKEDGTENLTKPSVN
jgi:hypothetical protein